MMIQSKLPGSFWAEAVLTANYVRNRCASKALKGETPYKLWFGKRPTVSHFKVFGTKSYVLNKKPNKGKFDMRSTECIFIGYSQQSKAYRLWSPSEKRVIVSRDVKFINEFNSSVDNENIFCDVLEKEAFIEATPDDPGENFDVVLHREEHDRKPGEESFNRSEDDNEALVSRPETKRKEKRARGRPRLIRTGGRGRPRKQYRTRLMSQQMNLDSETEYESTHFAQLSNQENLEEALTGPNAKKWRSAIKQEFLAIIKNNMWKIVERPKNSNLIGNRFVLQTKCNEKGKVERRKARLVESATWCSEDYR